MDDYSLGSLVESKNEWCSRLVTILTPCIIEGLKSIFDEAYKLCEEQEEDEKYLLTFQNFLAQLPKWNPSTIEEETKRISERSACGYLEDLITCVHIIHLKALTCSRVGMKQKKIDLSIPSLIDFIHKVYINVARKVYTTIYLFEKGITPLAIQKNNRELEVIIKEMILLTIRDSIPLEHILKAYLDETEELNVEVEEKQEIIPLKSEEVIIKNDSNNELENNEIESSKKILEGDKILEEKEKETEIKDNDELKEKVDITFSDIDIAVDNKGNQESIVAPKDIDTLEKISKENNQRRKEEEKEDEDDEKLVIGDSIDFKDDIKIDLGIKDLDININTPENIILKDIEIL